MADTSLPNLSELTSPADGDELIIVDKSDATDGATGTNKKITKDNLLKNTNAVIFSPQASKTYAEGTLYYSSANKALEYFNDEADVEMQLGRENWVRVYNNSGSTITNGSAVYISGKEDTEDGPTIALARADAANTSQLIGVAAHDIENATFGYVTQFGLVGGLNTASFSDGAPIWLSADTAGAFTATEPQSPNISVFIGWVLDSHATTGNIFFTSVGNTSGTTIQGDATQLTVPARKGTAGTITKGQAVYITGYNIGADAVEVELADADGSGTMPALGIANDSITNSATGNVVVSGRIANINTSAYSVNDSLYVSTTAGALTSTKPSGDTAGVQKIANVLRSNVSTGIIEVVGAGRTNDIPNSATPTGVWDFGGATSLEVPNSATPTVDADGEVAVDTTVADFSHGVMKYYGGEEMGVVAMPIAQFTSPTDGYGVTYNATNDEFELTDVSGGGGGNPYGADVVIAASGGDYTTLGAYVTAGATAGDVVYIQDATTETGSITLSTANVTLICKNPTAIINMGSNNLTISGANCSARNVYVDIDGEFLWNGAECDIDGLEITGSSTNQWTFRQTGEEGRVRGLKVINDATGTRTKVAVLLGGSNTAYTNIYASAAVTGASADVGIMNIAGASCTASNITIEDNGTLNSNTAAFLSITGSDCSVSNVTVFVNDNTYGYGVYANGLGATLTGIKVYRAAKTGFTITNQQAVSGCSSESFNSTTQHFNITGSDNVVTGCFAQSSGTTGSSNGFIIAGDDNVVTGNRAMSCTTGVTISSGNRNVVTGNALNANGTALTDSGTSTLYQTATSSDPLNTV